MTRRLLSGMLVTLAVGVAAPAGAQAQPVPCAAATTAAASANTRQVSDAIFCLTNQIRASYGLPAFHRDARLDEAARRHSQDMSVRHFFAHETPDGGTPSDRAAARGYTRGVGENIATGYADAAETMIGWMGSVGHCRNILSSARDIGIGTFAAGTPYYTQAFGDYAAGATNRASAGCPYHLEMGALLATAAGAAGPATGTGRQVATPAAGTLLTRLAVSAGRLRAGGRGSVVSYKLAAPATVALRAERYAGGRWRLLRGTLSDAGRQGANALRFRGRLAGRTLAPGRYRLRAIATDAAGNASPARHVGLRVTRR
jgi:uncharacterized protein YkwD